MHKWNFLEELHSKSIKVQFLVLNAMSRNIPLCLLNAFGLQWERDLQNV